MMQSVRNKGKDCRLQWQGDQGSALLYQGAGPFPFDKGREGSEGKFKDLVVHLIRQIETGKLEMFIHKYYGFLVSSVCWSSLLFQGPAIPTKFPTTRAFLMAETWDDPARWNHRDGWFLDAVILHVLP